MVHGLPASGGAGSDQGSGFRVTSIRRVAGSQNSAIRSGKCLVPPAFFADAQTDCFPFFLVCEYEPRWRDLAGGDVRELITSHGYDVIGRDGSNLLCIRRN